MLNWEGPRGAWSAAPGPAQDTPGSRSMSTSGAGALPGSVPGRGSAIPAAARALCKPQQPPGRPCVSGRLAPGSRHAGLGRAPVGP